MDLGISGRKAIVCASSRGLGKGCALALAEAGCELVVNGRDETALRHTSDEIEAISGKAPHIVLADIGTPGGRRAVLDACPEPDILINNNGGPPMKDFRELDHEAMIAGIEQNMITPIEMIQAVIDGMAERGFGRIVNITSMSVLSPIQGLDLSSGARAGLTAFLAGVCRQFADRNVTINNMLPGKMDTDRLRGGFAYRSKLSGKPVEEVADALAAQIPAKRFGTLEEFGRICAFLCSDHAGYLTGQNMRVDGGLFAAAF